MTGEKDHLLLALEEDECWKSNNRKGTFQSIVSDVLKRPQISVRRRRRLFTTVPASQPIWDRIGSGMSLWTGYEILLKASKKSRAQGVALGDAVISELADFDSAPRYKSGRKIFVRSPKAKARKAREPVLSDAHPADEVDPDSWARLKSAVDALVNDRLAKCDESVRDQVRVEIREEVRRTIKWVGGRIRSASEMPDFKSFGNGRSVPEEVIGWCKLLKVQVPGVGEPVNHEELKRTHRAWVRNYHPDRNAGNELEMNRRMGEINAAYDGLIAYNFSLENDR